MPNNDGVLDLLAVQADGAIIASFRQGRRQELGDRASIANPGCGAIISRDDVRLRVADLDNNGASICSVAHLRSSSGAGRAPGLAGRRKWQIHCCSESPMASALVFDVGRPQWRRQLDLLGLSADGRPAQGSQPRNENYHWQIIRPRARRRPATSASILRHRRRDRNPLRLAGAKAANHRPTAALRPGRADRRRRSTNPLAQRHRCAPSSR